MTSSTLASMADLKQVFRRYKIIALLIAIAIIWGFFSFMTDGGFVTPRNLSNLLRQMSVTGILACGMVLVIIAGEIDLSVGSLLGLLGGLAALLDVSHHLPLALNLVLALGFGLALGLLNGYLTAYLGIPSFIVGLGGMLAFRGILLGITGGLTIAPVSDNMVYLGQGYLPPQMGVALGIALFVLAVALTWMSRVNRSRHGLPLAALWRDALKVVVIGAVLLAFVRTLNSYDGIPVPVLLLLALLGLFSYVSTQTVFGRRIYSVGSNMEATRLSGVNVQAVKLWVFGIMGVMCALAGLVNTARLAAGSPSAGNMGELDAIAACFIGGTSMRGGSGTIYGALIGALVMASLDNGMSMLDVGTYWQMIVKGSILVLAVWVDVSTRSGR
ncbi:sugar ABC transporter permease [Herbaspirillum seropedicae]|uniref:Xylose transport system permease protein XylH n=1 Tax=Herbaspirillum seropedicae (strain SmR1) TaxID=757424 RepID=D8IWS5_HERSS|nr:sugar ABC transporter permease [Herbaspirillum seropedicae]ADJ65962.1 ABC-type D-xylose transport system, permease component protein [Herbaspirillum seropedicae SmR1]AON56874.1 D-xylose ABC transporter permease [Herbaspirillum seropedicae]MDR6398237.1 D-xylose transport system permease protein [Herbaspirillum seropedicae]